MGFLPASMSCNSASRSLRSCRSAAGAFSKRAISALSSLVRRCALAYCAPNCAKGIFLPLSDPSICLSSFCNSGNVRLASCSTRSGENNSSCPSGIPPSGISSSFSSATTAALRGAGSTPGSVNCSPGINERAGRALRANALSRISASSSCVTNSARANGRAACVPAFISAASCSRVMFLLGVKRGSSCGLRISSTTFS